MNRVVMHVDMDYFYAQVEERENPALKGRPVVVCVFSGRTAESGAVATANYEAREYGVHAGMPIYLAKKKCPQAKFIPVRMELYQAISERIKEVLVKYAGVVEKASIDEFYLDATKKSNGDFGKARDFAEKIKKEVLAKERLTCSIGVAPNKLVAKIASGIEKPSGLTAVLPAQVNGFLKKLEAGEVPGIGKKTGERLLELGVKTVGDLKKIDSAVLVKEFGKAKGAWLANVAKGIDETPVEEREREQIGEITTLKKDVGKASDVLNILDELSGRVHAKALEQKVLFKTIAVTFTTTELDLRTKSKTLENHVNELSAVKNTSRELSKSFFEENPGIALRRIGVRVSNLIHEAGQKKLAEF